MADMFIKKVHITPYMAACFLETNPRNRSMKPHKIRLLEEAIKNGEWEVTHQGIAIDENGKLLDGHHRLTAIVNTGIGVDMMVAFNAVESTKIDIGASRNDRDSLYMSGMIEKGSTEYVNVTYPLLTFIGNISFGQERARAMTSLEKHYAFKKYEDDITPIVNISNKYAKGKARGAAVLYAELCAYRAGVPIEVLEKWHSIVSTGDFYVEGDDEKTKAGRSVLLFKNFIESRSSLNGGIGVAKTTAEEKVNKAESSIYYYHHNIHVKKIYGKRFYPDLIFSEDDIRRA